MPSVAMTIDMQMEGVPIDMKYLYEYNDSLEKELSNITAKWKDVPISSLKNWHGVCWSPELRLFCAVAYGSNTAATSPDGITWTQKTLPSSKSWSSVCWSPELRLFCAVAGNSNTATIYGFN
jgi:hypothetical protein